MKKTRVIFGNMTFSGEIGKPETVCTIHEVYGFLDFDKKDELYEVAEDLCNTFISYVVPSDFPGEIVRECSNMVKVW